MNAEARIKALEAATGSTMTDDQAEALALQQMSDDELVRRARNILASCDPPAADDMSEDAIIERRARETIARYDARTARQ